MNAQAQGIFDFTAKRRPQHPYWPTTPITRDELAGAMRVAEQQDEAVLAIFRASRGPLSPSQVWQQGIDHGRKWLLTSVRRSITNLTGEFVLVKLAGTRMGPFGAKEGLWALPSRDAAA